MRIVNLLSLACLVVIAASPANAQADFYGGAAASGIYSSLAGDQSGDDLNGSAVVGRGYGGLRLNPKGNTTRLQAMSAYYAYLENGRKDRWSNGVEIEQTVRLGGGVTLGLEAAAATNVWTLEAQSADQIAGVARLAYEPDRRHRVEASAGVRRRSYDGVNAHGTSPIFGLDYRYRFGSYRYASLESAIETVDSNYDRYDYQRVSLGGFYSHPLAARGATRLRGGIVYRRWTWDERVAPSGRNLRDSSVTPQLRLIHAFSPATDIELDYRRVFRRSNDDSRDRNGNRLALSLRTTF